MSYQYAYIRAEDLLRLITHQLRTIVAILTRHAAVRTHLRTLGLFDGDPACRFCGQQAETSHHVICLCEAMARRRYYVFWGSAAEPKDIRTASVRARCLFIRGTGLLNVW
jgi:hypothetical protein